MLTFELRERCKNCTQADDAYEDLLSKIASMVKRMNQNRKYLSRKKVCKRTLKDLTYYKEILENLKWNPSYYDSICFSSEEIISKIKSISV